MRHDNKGGQDIEPADRSLRRSALQIAIQLPDNEKEALAILDLAHQATWD